MARIRKMGGGILRNPGTLKTSDETWWGRRAAFFQWRWNAAWWLEIILRGSVPFAVALALFLLVGRSLDLPARVLALTTACATVVCGLIALIPARRKFLTKASALAQLDDHLSLHSRLISASSGIGRWPEPRPEIRENIRWRKNRIAAHLIPSLILVTLAALVPMSSGEPKTAPTPSTPSALIQTESWLEQLAEENLTREDALSEFAKELERLKSQDPSEWYQHQNLEAGENLRDTLEAAMSEQQREIEMLARALHSLQSSHGKEWAAAIRTMEKALEELQGGALPVDAAKLLPPEALANVRQLSPEEMAALAKKIHKALGQAQGELAAESGSGQPQGSGPGAAEKGGMGPGKGGVSKGPGTAPLPLADHKTQLGTTRIEAIKGGEELPIPGEVVGLQAQTPEANPAQGTVPGGAASTSSTGGMIWDTNATPEEQEAIQRFFK